MGKMGVLIIVEVVIMAALWDRYDVYLATRAFLSSSTGLKASANAPYRMILQKTALRRFDISSNGSVHLTPVVRLHDAAVR